MTHFLLTDDNPEGYKLEDILTIVRQDIIKRLGLIAADKRPELAASRPTIFKFSRRSPKVSNWPKFQRKFLTVLSVRAAWNPVSAPPDAVWLSASFLRLPRPGAGLGSVSGSC